MKIRYDVVSDVGRVRTNNEDMALVFGAFLRDNAQRSMVPMARRPRFTALVADGMGGYGGGEIASEMTLRSFDEFIRSLPPDMSPRELMQTVKDWFRINQEAVLARAASDPELAQMGTTLTGIFSYGPDEYMLNAGDSRVYRWRYDTLRQLTRDHSERERTGDPDTPSNLIYNAVGVPGAFVDVTCLSAEMPVIDGDVYVICSDGLCDMISDDEISAILARGGSARDLVDAALAAGGADNCTVIVLTVSRPDEEEEPVQTEIPDSTREPESAQSTQEPDSTQEPESARSTQEPESTQEPASPQSPQSIPSAQEPPSPQSEGFAIDEPEPGPVPPPYHPPVSDGEQEISIEEAMKLPQGEPTPEEKRGMALRRLRDIFFGRH